MRTGSSAVCTGIPNVSQELGTVTSVSLGSSAPSGHDQERKFLRSPVSMFNVRIQYVAADGTSPAVGYADRVRTWAESVLSSYRPNLTNSRSTAS